MFQNYWCHISISLSIDESYEFLVRCAFGVDTDMQTDTENIYLKHTNNYFSPKYNKLPILKLRFLIPEIDSLLCKILDKINLVKRTIKRFIPSIEDDDRSWLYSRIQDVIEMRSEKAKQRIDLLQLLLDAATKNKIMEEADHESEMLSYNEVKTNIHLFMLAGYETTATALAYCTYVLANHLTIQRKVQAEIDQYIGVIERKEQNPDYDLVNRMEYLDLFIREVLRMYPIPLAVFNRRCVNETTVCGYKIAK
ncbi:unnamed protein product, partial [Didymodactylos carnosus]